MEQFFAFGTARGRAMGEQKAHARQLFAQLRQQNRSRPRLAERERLSAALQALLREGWLERAAQRYR